MFKKNFFSKIFSKNFYFLIFFLILEHNFFLDITIVFDRTRSSLDSEFKRRTNESVFAGRLGRLSNSGIFDIAGFRFCFFDGV